MTTNATFCVGHADYTYEEKEFGAHYMAVVDNAIDTHLRVVKGNVFTFLICNTKKDVAGDVCLPVIKNINRDNLKNRAI